VLRQTTQEIILPPVSSPVSSPVAARPDTSETPKRRSRAKPKPARPRIVVISELRGLGGLVLEQALLDGTAEPRPSLVRWANRLAAELDVAGIEAPADYRELMREIVAVNRRAAADPGRPLVALPPAL
jgi:hypothetical protein